MNPLLTLRMMKLAELIQTRKVSPVEVTEAFIAQAERVNPRLNALVAHRFDEALEEARRAEKTVMKGGHLPPLIGLPWTTKEMLSVGGMPNTAGSEHRRGNIADTDAMVVKRVRDAGAINLGVSNQSELGLWCESNNPIYGRTNNPWDLERTAGGSSGGEGALVASAATGFGIGSDMGGSIRIPSLYCGIYGHKSGKGRVSADGHFPQDFSPARLPNPPDVRYISIGPMTRDARDLLPLFNVMAGTHEVRKSLKNRKVYLLEDPNIRLCSQSSAEQQHAVKRAGEVLKDAGMHVEVWDFVDFKNAVNIYTGTLAAESDVNLQDLIGGGTRPKLRREIPLTAQRKGIHTAPALLLSLGERFIRPSARQIAALVRERDTMLARINQVLGEDAVLIMPTLPQTAPRHNHSMLRPFDMMFTALFNVLEVPVTSAPMGVGNMGVPLGVQIIGAVGQDALTMSVAEALQESQGWQIPPLVKR